MHARWAMLGVAGILAQEITHPEQFWYMQVRARTARRRPLQLRRMACDTLLERTNKPRLPPRHALTPPPPPPSPPPSPVSRPPE